MNNKKAPRDCQRQAFTKRRKSDKPVFAAWLSTGGGKTYLAAMCAQDDLTQEVEQVFYIAPSDDVGTAFAAEMHDQFDLCIVEWDARGGQAPHCKVCASLGKKTGPVGYYTTYAQLAHRDVYRHNFAADVARRPTLVILDEIHHATDSAWGRAFLPGAAAPGRVLLLSATPARTDGSPIPFVHDMEGRPDGAGGTVHDIVLDDSQIYSYPYGRALIDRVVTRLVFRGLQGQVQWLDDDGNQVVVDVHQENQPELLRRARSRLHMSNATQSGIALALQEFRATLSADHRALMAVTVQTQYEAERLADGIRAQGFRTALMTGACMVDGRGVTYNTKERMVRQLRQDDTQVLVVVDQFSEGTDIPRTRAYVYMRSTRTRLHFQQSLGRAIRVAEHLPWEQQDAYFYYWDDADIRTFVAEVKAEMEAADAYVRAAGEARDPSGTQDRPLSPGNGRLLGDDTVLIGDQDFTADDWERSVEVAEEFSADPAFVHRIREAFSEPRPHREPSFTEAQADQERSVQRINRAIKAVVRPWAQGKTMPKGFVPYPILRGECNHLFRTSANRWAATEADVDKAVDWVYSHGSGYLDDRFKKWSR